MNIIGTLGLPELMAMLIPLLILLAILVIVKAATGKI